MEEDEPVYTEDIEPLHDPMTVIDKGIALKYYDAGATIYLITPFSQLIAASERMEIERGADHFSCQYMSRHCYRIWKLRWRIIRSCSH